MNWARMKEIDTGGELERLEHAAFIAGHSGADWWSCWTAQIQALSKIVGHGGHDERLRSDLCFVLARRALYEAWRVGEAEADRAACGCCRVVDEQATLFDCSDIYQ